ncbi:MAG: protein-export chaperone SecB [Alphaproteobacteria bacterium]
MDQTPPDQALMIMAQYIKDFSFENPNSPLIYQALSQGAPEIKVNVDIVPAVLDQRIFEVILAIRIGATIGEKTAFLIELDYAGIVQIGTSVPEAALEPLLFSETPRHLYPFARAVLAKVTGDAAFPPLYVNPIDFEGFYRTNKVGALAAVMGTSDATPDAETPDAEGPDAEAPDAEAPDAETPAAATTTPEVG